MDHNVNTADHFQDLFVTFKKEKAKVEITLSVMIHNAAGVSPPSYPMRVMGDVLVCAQDYVSVRNASGRVSYISYGAIVCIEEAT